MKKLEAGGARVAYNDPYAPIIRMTHDHAQFCGRCSVPLTDRERGYDLILPATAHHAYRWHDVSQLVIHWWIPATASSPRLPGSYLPSTIFS